LVAAAPEALAQPAPAAGDFFSALAGFAGKSGPEIGAAVSRSVHSDDPAIEAAITEYYANLDAVETAREPRRSPSPVPSSDTLALFNQALAASPALARPEPALPAEYIAAIEKTVSESHANEQLRQLIQTLLLEGFDAPLPNWQPVFKPGRDPADGTSALGGVAGMTGCTIDDVRMALAPFKAVAVSLSEDAGVLAHFDSHQPSIGQPSLALAHDLDALSGGSYWTQRWHAAATQLMLKAIDVNFIFYDAIFRANDALWDAVINQGSPLTVQAAAPLYEKVMESRRALLFAIRDLISTLRARGCEDQADQVHVHAAQVYAVGEERKRFEGMDPDIWRTRGFDPPTPHWVPQWITYLRSASDLADGTADALITGPEVGEVLGPVPEVKASSRSAAEQAPRAEAVLPDITDFQHLQIVPDPEGRTTEDARGDEDDEEVDSWERSDRGGELAMEGAPRLQPSGADGEPSTWLSAAGMGTWPQPDLGGFWRTEGIVDAEGQITLIEVTDDRGRFTGRIVENGELHGDWIRMEKDGSSHAWRGEISIAQLPIPPGRCPRWTRGAFLTPPAALRINGAWTAKKVDPETCEETEEPDHGLVRLERVVATSFQPIIPGKYIHVIAVPGGGSTAAQYKAAVEFRCTTTGLPPVEPAITASAGEIVAGAEPCHYQLVVTAAGSYDITVEFKDSAGKVLHRDVLRADVPPIPGLT